MASEIDDSDLELLIWAAEDLRREVGLVVISCVYSCCGRPWERRDGYEQHYHGYIDNLKMPEGEKDGTFMLYSRGLGTISYVLACRFDEVLDVQR